MDIFEAIEHSDNILLQNLIQSGVDVNVTDDFGQTPLHLAIDTAYEEAIYIYETENKVVQPRMDIIKALLEGGADHLKKDNKGKSPISWAEERKNEKFLIDLKELIKKSTAL